MKVRSRFICLNFLQIRWHSYVIGRSISFWESTKLALSFFFSFQTSIIAPKSQTGFYLGACIDSTGILSPILTSLHPDTSFMRVNIFSLLEWLALFPLRRLLAIHGVLFLRIVGGRFRTDRFFPLLLQKFRVTNVQLLLRANQFETSKPPLSNIWILRYIRKS